MLLIPKRYTNVFEKYLNELLFVSIYIIAETKESGKMKEKR